MLLVVGFIVVTVTVGVAANVVADFLLFASGSGLVAGVVPWAARRLVHVVGLLAGSISELVLAITGLGSETIVVVVNTECWSRTIR